MRLSDCFTRALVSAAMLLATGAAYSQGPPAPFQRWSPSHPSVQIQVLAPGATFPFDRAFSGRIVNAEIRPYLVLGGREAAPIGNEQFLVVTIELVNEGQLAIAPPIMGIKWLSMRDSSRTIRPAPITTPLNLDPRLGGSQTPIPPGGTGRLLAVYPVPPQIPPGSLFYTVDWDAVDSRLVLAALPR